MRYFILFLFVLGCSADLEISSINKTDDIIGILGVHDTDDFAMISNIGARTVGIGMPLSFDELEHAKKKASENTLQLIARAAGMKNFQTQDKALDFRKLEELLSQYETADIIYLIDEPCHPEKWNIDTDDLIDAYSIAKHVNPQTQIFINFASLECLDVLISDCPDDKITDIAAFTITQTNLNRDRDYIKNQDSLAMKAKKCFPDIKIVPLIAVYEYPDRQQELPSAEWVRDKGITVLQHDGFDGILFFPWQPSDYMGKTIRDVYDTTYSDSFREVFYEAKRK